MSARDSRNRSGKYYVFRARMPARRYEENIVTGKISNWVDVEYAGKGEWKLSNHLCKLDQVRLALAEVIQNSGLPPGTYIDTEALAKAAIKVLGEPTKPAEDLPATSRASHYS